MRILVAGAGGVVGRALLPALVARGHSVAGMVRRGASASVITDLGAEPIVGDALDATFVAEHCRRLRPEAVIHQLTALPVTTDLRHFDRLFAQTNLLRTRGTDILLAASRDAGVRRFVAQSFCGWPYARTGGAVKTEDDPLDPDPPAAFRGTLKAIRYLEGAVAAAHGVGGVNLRYGGFYGPGTVLSQDGAMLHQVRRRLFPIIGNGGGVWSFIHIADVASATVAAVESDVVGTFNVVDDEPAPVSEWLPYLADVIGAKPPWRIPAMLARLILPEHLMVMMSSVRGGSNARFKPLFDWKPAFSTWRDGFRQGLG
jgi:nucleoside-diphosphate-sugar epimerase